MSGRAGMVAGLVVALALANWATAQEGGEKKGRQANRVTGTFISAQLAGETVTWKITNEDDQAEKSLDMAAKVAVLYGEKKGENRVMSLRPVGKRAPAARGNRLVAEGTFVKAEAQGNKVAVTIKVEGDQGGEKVFLLPNRLEVAYREKRGTVTATSVGPVPRARKEAAGEGKHGGNRDKGGEAPQ